MRFRDVGRVKGRSLPSRAPRFARRALQPSAVATIAALAVALLLLSGCSLATGSSRQESAVQPESQRAIATAIAVKAAQGSRPATPKTIAASDPRTVSDILAGAPTSGLLDSVHLAAGKGCEACHGKLPAGGSPTMPTTATCLSCHGGSYEALGAKTANAPGGVNPHKAHTGKLDCDRCHRVHAPFEYSCNNCHSFSIPERFRSAG